MTTSRPIRLTFLLVSCGISQIVPSRPAVAGGPWFHHGHGQSAVIVLPPSSVQTATLVPATSQLRLAPVSQLPSGTMSGLQVAPAATTLTMPGLTLSGGSSTLYYVTQPGAGLGVAPQPVAGSRGLTTGPGGVTDNDYQILAAGFGGSFLNVQNFEKFLANELDKLVNQNSNFSQDQLVTLLLDAARTFLTSQGFGFLLDPTIDGIIKRLIGKVIQNRQASQGGSGGGGGGGGNANIPAGGFTFTVSGQIVLTPAGGGPVNPGGNKPIPGNGLPSGLTPDEPGLQPPAPPSR